QSAKPSRNASRTRASDSVGFITVRTSNAIWKSWVLVRIRRGFVGHFFDLPSLPMHLIPDFVRQLGLKAGDDAASNSFLEFFEENYVRDRCRFPVACWSLYNRHEDEIPTTNNFLEANNSVINHQIGYHRHHFIRTMQVLQRDHSRSVVVKAKLDLDDADYPQRHSKAYQCFLSNLRIIRRNFPPILDNPGTNVENNLPQIERYLKEVSKVNGWKRKRSCKLLGLRRFSMEGVGVCRGDEIK
ncbi:hypothetical protein Ciccas_013087, partial [Cichlidogyrus casuarinus]